MKETGQLEGQMLIAMPGIGDPRFERTVIFMCAHSPEGAMGLVVNKPAEDLTFVDLLDRLNILPEDEQIRIPEATRQMLVQFGGPVETGRGFVLHTTDYYIADSTLPIDDRIGLTATLDILRAIAEGEGPRRALLALGYAGWGPGQLENEMLHNGWLHCEADESLLFGGDLESRYDQALRKIGIDISMLSSEAGRA
jgi:putative transcriptional regulator